jgi:D-arabinose 1-dehydrogenase-like Zn-dependent alcohol dehydrogenase
MSEVMRAAQIVKVSDVIAKVSCSNKLQFKGDYQLCERRIPQCGEHDLLVKVHAAGFCHSDLQVLQGQFAADLPMIPSHEPAGTIAQIGTKVHGPWKVGDRVGVLNFKHACGHCVGCRQNRRKSFRSDPRFCQQREMAGFKHDGAFAEFMIADPNTTINLPDTVSFEQGAPLMCAGVSLLPHCRMACQKVGLADCVQGHGLGCIKEVES